MIPLYIKISRVVRQFPFHTEQQIGCLVDLGTGRGEEWSMPGGASGRDVQGSPQKLWVAESINHGGNS